MGTTGIQFRRDACRDKISSRITELVNCFNTPTHSRLAWNLLDFLQYCRRILFHERDFHSSLLHLRMSSFFVHHCYCFQTKYFLVFSQLVPCCCITHYRGNLLQLLLPHQLQLRVPSMLPLCFDFGSTARIARACGSAAQSFSLRLFSP